MPRYDSGDVIGRSITSVKLDGREVLRELYIRTADTDEGWLDVHETELVNGKKRCKLTPWRDVPLEVVVDGIQMKRTRDFVMKRIHGKVEVVLGEAPVETE